MQEMGLGGIFPGGMRRLDVPRTFVPLHEEKIRPTQVNSQG